MGPLCGPSHETPLSAFEVIPLIVAKTGSRVLDAISRRRGPETIGVDHHGLVGARHLARRDIDGFEYASIRISPEMMLPASLTAKTGYL